MINNKTIEPPKHLQDINNIYTPLIDLISWSYNEYKKDPKNKDLYYTVCDLQDQFYKLSRLVEKKGI